MKGQSKKPSGVTESKPSPPDKAQKTLNPTNIGKKL
jgi:hypothetical protein